MHTPSHAECKGERWSSALLLLSYSQGSLCKIGAFQFLARLVVSKSKPSAVSCLQSVGLPPDMHFLHLAILIKQRK